MLFLLPSTEKSSTPFNATPKSVLLCVRKWDRVNCRISAGTWSLSELSLEINLLLDLSTAPTMLAILKGTIDRERKIRER